MIRRLLSQHNDSSPGMLLQWLHHTERFSDILTAISVERCVSLMCSVVRRCSKGYHGDIATHIHVQIIIRINFIHAPITSLEWRNLALLPLLPFYNLTTILTKIPSQGVSYRLGARTHIFTIIIIIKFSRLLCTHLL